MDGQTDGWTAPLLKIYIASTVNHKMDLLR